MLFEMYKKEKEVDLRFHDKRFNRRETIGQRWETQKSEGLPLSPQYRINGADLCVVTKTVIKTTITPWLDPATLKNIYILFHILYLRTPVNP